MNKFFQDHVSVISNIFRVYKSDSQLSGHPFMMSTKNDQCFDTPPQLPHS